MAKTLTNELWRVLQTWTTNKIKGLWDGEAQEFTNILDTAKSQYAGAVYLTQAEYDALSEEEKMDASKVYFIEEE
jgi:hypothetical protein